MWVKKLFLLLFTLGATFMVNAQAWQQVGGGLNLKPKTFPSMVAEEANGNQYVAWVDSLQAINVAKWNGLSWSQFPKLVTGNNSPGVYDLVITPNEELYLSVDLPIDSGALYYFDGSSWSQQMGGVFSGGIVDLFYDSDTLFMAGQFLVNNTTPFLRNIASYDGANYVDYPSVSGNTYDSLTYITKVGNELHVSGFYGVFPINDTIPVSVLRGGAWEPVATNFVGFTNIAQYGVSFFELNGRRWFAGYDGQFANEIKLYEVNGDSISAPISITNVTNFFFGNITQTQTQKGHYFAFPRGAVIELDTAGSLSEILGLPAQVGVISSIQNELYFYGRDTAINPQLYPGPRNYAYSSQNNFARVSGRVYLDSDNDCTPDPGEQPIPFSLIDLQLGGTNITFSSNSAGYYSALIPPGTYSFSNPTNIAQLYQYVNNSCTLPTSISLSANQNFKQDIGLSHNGTTDALINLESNTGAALFGFEGDYQVVIQNPGTSINSLINVEVDLPLTVSFVNATPQPTSITGNTYSFNFSNLAMFEEKTIDIRLRTDTVGNNLGDTLMFTTRLNGVTGDVDLTNNTDTLKLEVRGAYDPNDKTPNATQIKPGTNRIDYRIRFQNTGNASAFKVTVVDTLDLTLPVTAIIMNSASHAYSISVQNNVLIWEFNNIMLPDSASDPLGSQGYISFSAGLNPALGLGDSIFNDAEIYFDYQPPIHTNKATTAIVDNISLLESTTSIHVKVYPNPSSNIIYIDLEEHLPTTTFNLYDINGKVIKTLQVSPGQRAELKVAEFSKGVYTLRSSYSAKKIILK
jgi:uncharacterized repeat protein (TIGR01451 family)